ncbi:MAG: NlpC/P60 family protein [Thermomonas sp.]|uniref:C40 family peptidase n=1 Tax=Thermomonas sp. TaxID=1971895 RepID=UPI0039E36A4F
MTPAIQPHGHSATRAKRGIQLLSTLILAAATVPALAVNPVVAPTSSAAVPALDTAAIPQPATTVPESPLAAIATPDTAPLAEQLRALRKAQEAQQATNKPSGIRSVLQNAFTLLGTPYRWGGTSPDKGFDCSGLVGYVFRTIGIDLPRVSRAMASEGMEVDSREALAEGDLVFFGRRGRIDHVGIYIGEGKFLHAPRTGRDVTVSSLTTGYWAQRYMQARRIAAGG